MSNATSAHSTPSKPAIKRLSTTTKTTTTTTRSTVTTKSTTTLTDIELCIRHREGKEAMGVIVARHGGLARSWASRMKREGQCCSQDDLVQEARRGLIDAAEHFDPERGAFSTVASLWIKKRIFALIEKAKQFGGQNDTINEQVGEERAGVDRSHLIAQFDRVEKLFHLGWIDERDVEIMRAICSPLSEQDEAVKPLFARWWKGAQRATLKKVADAARGYDDHKRRIRGGRILSDSEVAAAMTAAETVAELELQKEMW